MLNWNPFNFNNLVNQDGDGGTATKDEFQIGTNNRIHSPSDSDPNSNTDVGATIIDVRTPQNAALVANNGCLTDNCVGVYGQCDAFDHNVGIGVVGSCPNGCGVA